MCDLCSPDLRIVPGKSFYVVFSRQNWCKQRLLSFFFARFLAKPRQSRRHGFVLKLRRINAFLALIPPKLHLNTANISIFWWGDGSNLLHLSPPVLVIGVVQETLREKETKKPRSPIVILEHQSR